MAGTIGRLDTAQVD